MYCWIVAAESCKLYICLKTRQNQQCQVEPHIRKYDAARNEKRDQMNPSSTLQTGRSSSATSALASDAGPNRSFVYSILQCSLHQKCKNKILRLRDRQAQSFMLQLLIQQNVKFRTLTINQNEE
ncbi:Hypothetical_protein [Hexamita inflata]|uniref:Hypothetical_protein n=1 Tax=Hexamita inflata TaxID=28002 RepID=A0ABP1J6C8_9EUKA